MKRPANHFLYLSIFFLCFYSIFAAVVANAQALDKTIVTRTADIDGVKLHYMTAGHGKAVILLHGYAETSLMWKPILPLLAE